MRYIKNLFTRDISTRKNTHYRIKLLPLNIIVRNIFKLLREIFLLLVSGMFVGITYANIYSRCFEKGLIYILLFIPITIVYFIVVALAINYVSSMIIEFRMDEIFW